MGKTGWQVVAAISASAALMFGALAWNNARALEVANASLSTPGANPECTTPVAVPTLPAVSLSADSLLRDDNHELMSKRPDIAKCVGGELFVKIKDEWRNNGPC